MSIYNGNQQQGCEIFFLQIGMQDEDSSQSGDAIVLTMGSFSSNRVNSNRDDYRIIVVDGAFTSDAKTIKEHLGVIGAQNKNDKLQIDLMVSTHSDQDHISGLIALIEDDDIEVKKLWIHDCTKVRVRECSIDQARDLIDLAKKRGIPMEEPFTGVTYSPDGIDACIEVLGPTREYYAEMMEGSENVFPGTGKAKSLLKKISDWTLEQLEQIFENEFLKDPEENATSNSNNSSTILLLKFFKNGEINHLALFTADAGVPALNEVIPSLKESGWYEQSVRKFIQVPHHGSRRNVGPTILDELLGSREINCRRGTCFVSAHKNDEKHPKKQVLNAFIRRGYRDIENIHRSKMHGIGQVPDIPGWNSVLQYINLLPGEEEEND